MVQSLLNPSINYPEIKILDKDDIDYDATLYQSNILGVNDVKIALGQPKYSFIESDIIYFPIYLVINDLFNSQNRCLMKIFFYTTFLILLMKMMMLILDKII